MVTLDKMMKRTTKVQNNQTQSWQGYGLSKSATVASLSDNLKEWDPGPIDRFVYAPLALNASLAR
jgi:hypothetical protein